MVETIGNYLSKDVLYKTIPSLDNFSSTSLSNSVVLLFFNSFDASNKELEMFFKTLIQTSPLAITVCGIDADKYFERLLQLLSMASKKQHIMTYISKSELYLDDFFLASWPEEERHDDWKNYVILEIGGFHIKESVKTYLSKPH